MQIPCQKNSQWRRTFTKWGQTPSGWSRRQRAQEKLRSNVVEVTARLASITVCPCEGAFLADFAVFRFVILHYAQASTDINISYIIW